MLSPFRRVRTSERTLVLCTFGALAVQAHTCMHMYTQAHVCTHNGCTRSHMSMQIHMYMHTLDMQTHMCAHIQDTRCAGSHMYAGSCVYTQQTYTFICACTRECAGSGVHVHTRHAHMHWLQARTYVCALVAGSQGHTPGVHTQPLRGVSAWRSGSSEEHIRQGVWHVLLGGPVHVAGAARV